MSVSVPLAPPRDGPGQKRRVLFVDDERRILDGLRRSLSAQRRVWEMSFVESGAEALEAMAAQPFDVIVTDFRMPGLDGGQLLRRVQERYPDTARLMLSGHTDASDLLEAMAVAHRFLDKPGDRTVLVAAIERGLWLRDALAGEPVRAELGAIATLPAGASTLHRLQRVLDDPDSTLADVSEVVACDVGLTLKILQLANASCVGPRDVDASIAGALASVGLPAVRALALMGELSSPVEEGDELGQEWLARINLHACLTSRIARRLVPPADALQAFCAAVVVECGQLAFASCRPRRMSELIRDDDRSPGRAAEREVAEFGISHADAGAYLLGLWGFPAAVVRAVSEHDLPIPPNDGAPLDVSSAVRVARAVAEHHVAGVCRPRDSAGIDAWIADPRCALDQARLGPSGPTRAAGDDPR